MSTTDDEPVIDLENVEGLIDKLNAGFIPENTGIGGYSVSSILHAAQPDGIVFKARKIKRGSQVVVITDEVLAEISRERNLTIESYGEGLVKISTKPNNRSDISSDDLSVIPAPVFQNILDGDDLDDLDFPPLPSTLPPSAHPTNEGKYPQPLLPPPPSSLLDGSSRSDDEIPVDEEFPLPPSSEILYPELWPSANVHEFVKSPGIKTAEGNTISSGPEIVSSENASNVDVKSSNGTLPNYFNFLNTSTKLPFFKKKDTTSLVSIPSFNKVEEKTLPDVELAREIVKKAEKTTISKTNYSSHTVLNVDVKGDASNDSEIPKDSGIFSSSETLQSPTGCVDVFADQRDDKGESNYKASDAFSIAKEQLAKNETLSNIIKDYYNDTAPVQPDGEVTENKLRVKANRPIIANALLPKHLKGASESDMVNVPNLNSINRKDSVDATLGELKDIFNSSRDVTNILASSKKWLGYGACPGKSFRSFSLDIHNDDISLDNADTIINNNSNLDQFNQNADTWRKSADSNKPDSLTTEQDLGEMPQKVKPAKQSRTFRLAKTPRVTGFSEEQIKNMISLQASNSRSTVSERNEGKEDNIPAKSDNDDNKQDECKFFQKDSKPFQHKFYGFVGTTKVNDFTDKQTTGILSNESAQIKREEKDLDKASTGQDSKDNKNIFKKTEQKVNEEGKAVNIEIIQNSKKKFKSLASTDAQGFTEQPSKEVSLARSKSLVGSFQKKLEVDKVQKSAEAEISRDISGFKNKAVSETNNDFQKNNREDNNDSDIIEKTLPVSEKKAFFESIKQSTPAKTTPRPLPRKSLSFSSRTTDDNSKLNKLRSKFQSFEKPGERNECETQGEATKKLLTKMESLTEVSGTEKMESLSEVSDKIDGGEHVDCAPQLPFENLLTKFNSPRRTPSNKSAFPIYRVPPQPETKLPGKSLTPVQDEPSKIATDPSTRSETWKSFLQTYSKNNNV